jgi:hypothetical protein
MEVVGAAASVAGLLSLVGQSLDGIFKLLGFIKTFNAAQSTLNIFLRDVESLQSSLIRIQRLLTHLPLDQPIVTETLNLEGLAWQINACLKEVKDWEYSAKKYSKSPPTNIKGFFKKFRVAVNKAGFSEFHGRIMQHQQGLNLILAVLGP